VTIPYAEIPQGAGGSSTAAAADYFRLNVFYLAQVRTAALYDAFGVIGTALSKKISVLHSSSLKLASITPNAS
jgi:hypothetical protein